MVIRCTQQKICALIEKTHVESRIGFQFSTYRISKSPMKSSMRSLTTSMNLQLFQNPEKSTIFTHVAQIWLKLPWICWSPPSEVRGATWEVEVSFFKKYFEVCMVRSWIFSLAQKKKLNTFKYLDHDHKVNRKFSTAILKNVLDQSESFIKNFQPNFSLRFSNSNVLHFSCPMIQFVCRIVTIFWLSWKIIQKEPARFCAICQFEWNGILRNLQIGLFSWTF